MSLNNTRAGVSGGEVSRRDECYCDVPKVKGIVFVSKYMIKKYGVIDGLIRTMKRKTSIKSKNYDTHSSTN